MALKPVSDPALLAQLNAEATPARKPVTDPALLAKLNGEPERPGYFENLANATRKAGAADVAYTEQAIPGVLEAAVNAGTSVIAPIPAAVDTLLARAGWTDPNNPNADYATAREKYTYEPRTEPGKARTEQIGALFRPVGDVLGSAGKIAGEISRDLGAPEQVSRDIEQMTPDMIGAALTRVPEAAGAVKRAVSDRPKVPAEEPIPTTQELSARKQELYQASKDAGVMSDPASFSKFVSQTGEAIRARPHSEKLHPGTLASLELLEKEAQRGTPMSLEQLDLLRQEVREAPKSSQDARLNNMILSRLDEYMNQISADNPRGIAALKSARETAAREFRSKDFDEMLRKVGIRADSKFTQSGDENAVRDAFRSLALNTEEMAKLTPEQRAAVESVARGGRTRGERFVGNTIRGLGKFDPTTGVVSALGSFGTGGLLAHASSGASLLLPAAGFGARRLATAMTRRRAVNAHAAIVGRGLPPSAEGLGAALQRAGMAPAEGVVMQRPMLALPAPNIIAGSRSAPGTAYAREEMGLTPDVERAGALHPGMARESLAPRTAPSLPYRQAEQQPLVVDLAGRIAQTRAELEQYLRDTGQERMRNVRQPRAEPMTQQERLAEALGRSGPRSIDQIREDLARLDAKAQRLPPDEPMDSPRSQAIEAEYQKLTNELKSAVSPPPSAPYSAGNANSG